MRKILSTILLLLPACLTYAGAEVFSYLYIQGDKKTPFYVKLDEEMQPRYGKNYCIIPRLAPGPTHIEILFQQNIFPPQKFTVLIPETGSRGFLLVQKDGGFSLYDLQQGFYLPADNKEDDDHLPAAGAGANTVTAPLPIETQINQEPESRPKPVVKKPRQSTKKPVQKKPAPVKKVDVKDGEPVFISDIELSKGERRDSGNVAIAIPKPSIESQPVVLNSDCPTPLSSADFGKVFSGVAAFSEDEERLEYLNGQMGFCYETWQARTLAGKLTGDAAKFEFLKKVYPRITDQAAFPLLDDLLTAEVWKAEFMRLVRR